MNQPTNAQALISHLPAHAARTLAVEILLSDIGWLDDDVMESCLYILKERLESPEAKHLRDPRAQGPSPRIPTP